MCPERGLGPQEVLGPTAFLLLSPNTPAHPWSQRLLRNGPVAHQSLSEAFLEL